MLGRLCPRGREPHCQPQPQGCPTRDGIQAHHPSKHIMQPPRTELRPQSRQGWPQAHNTGMSHGSDPRIPLVPLAPSLPRAAQHPPAQPHCLSAPCISPPPRTSSCSLTGRPSNLRASAKPRALSTPPAPDRRGEAAGRGAGGAPCGQRGVPPPTPRQAGPGRRPPSAPISAAHGGLTAAPGPEGAEPPGRPPPNREPSPRPPPHPPRRGTQPGGSEGGGRAGGTAAGRPHGGHAAMEGGGTPRIRRRARSSGPAPQPPVRRFQRSPRGSPRLGGGTGPLPPAPASRGPRRASPCPKPAPNLSSEPHRRHGAPRAAAKAPPSPAGEAAGREKGAGRALTGLQRAPVRPGHLHRRRERGRERGARSRARPPLRHGGGAGRGAALRAARWEL